MKYFVVLLSLAFLLSCGGNTSSVKTPVNDDKAEPKTETTKTVDVKDKSFDELFKKVQPAELTDNVFKLVGEDYTVITSGEGEKYNSMTASYGGWGRLFEEPVTWCFLRANRYTLELMKESKTYTMTYFADEYKDQVMYFGSVSGRDSEKMKNHKLTPVQTPDGTPAYKEAKLIVECKLMEVTTVNPADFYMEKGKSFVEEAYAEAKDYHKLVFGQITNVWVRK